jgi:hypothetical protein
MEHEQNPVENQESHSDHHSPRGRYLRNQSGFWWLTRPDDPNDPGSWLSDPLKARARVYIEGPPYSGGGEWALQIEATLTSGDARRILIRYGSLHIGSRELIATLARAGFRIAVDRKSQERFLNYLARVRPPSLLRLGELTVQGKDGILCLRAFTLAPEGGTYEPHSFELYDLYDGGRKLPQVVRILDHDDTYGDVV